MSVRVRFAPSPTGYLHVGGARTALFNWLFARNNGGEFILRIEDTDENRSDQEMVSVILEGLETLGLDWDEGPYFQSERTALYRKNCEQLLEKGLAYYDFSEQGSAPDEYRCFRELPLAEAREKILEGQEPAVRFRVPGEGTIKFRDLVFGDIAVQSGEVDDFVIARSRGIPTTIEPACLIKGDRVRESRSEKASSFSVCTGSSSCSSVLKSSVKEKEGPGIEK